MGRAGRRLIQLVGLGATLAGCSPNTSGLGSSGAPMTTEDPPTSTTGLPDEGTTAGSRGGTHDGSSAETTVGLNATTDGATTSGTTTDRGTTDSSGDSSTGEPPPTGPFGRPVPVDILNEPTVIDDDPSLTADLLEIVFASNRTGTQRIYSATRESLGDAWSDPVLVPGLNDGSPPDNTPEISADGLVLLFSSMRSGGLGSWDVYVSFRDDRTSPWSGPTLVEDLSHPGYEISAALTVDLSQIYLCSERPMGLGLADIWFTDATVMGSSLSVGTLELDSDVSGNASDCSATLDAGRTTIYFETNRAGGFDIWMAERATPDDPFGAPVAADELNEPGLLDIDPWLSPDGHFMYFARGSDNDQDIYVAER